MDLKALIFITLLCFVHEIKSEIVYCDYFEDEIYADSERIPGYGCQINKIDPNKADDEFILNGTHLKRRADKDVHIVSYQTINDDETLSFGHSVCEDFKNLAIIVLKNIKIEEDSFQSCMNLKSLYLLGNNKIIEISESLLNNSIELLNLKINHNQIESLPANLLESHTELQSLNLYANNIEFLPSNILNSLTKLQDLNLGENKIHTLNANWFENLEDLEELDLKNNKISNLPAKIFQNLKNLKILNLSKNQIEFLIQHWGLNLEELQELDLSDNKIKEISQHYFETLENLLDLNLGGNRIKNLQQNSFSKLSNLKFLDLGSNQVYDLPQSVFINLTELAVLRLNDNKLTTIKSDSFGIHENLATISLQRNKIDKIDEKLINNTIISDFNMQDNICSQSWILDEDEIRQKLKNCFDNFNIDFDEKTKFTENKVNFTTISTSTTRTLTTETSQSSSTIAAKKTGWHANRIFEHNDCGKQKVGQPTIIGGTKILRGTFPWNAALYRSDGFFCGGTLVSNSTVITAAHCFREKNSPNIALARDISVLLGAFNLSNSIEIGKIVVGVKNIDIHPDWNEKIPSYDADIAILELHEDVHFSTYIQPICLIKPSLDFPLDASGVVAGFGRSERNSIETIANVIEVPVISFHECTKSSNHHSIISPRTICGGYANGTGVCNGDSGSGLIVQHNGAYYLRGIVSASLFGDNNQCNVKAYSVFTDVTKYFDWITTGNDIKYAFEIKQLKEKIEMLEEQNKLLQLIANSYNGKS